MRTSAWAVAGAAGGSVVLVLAFLSLSLHHLWRSVRGRRITDVPNIPDTSAETDVRQAFFLSRVAVSSHRGKR
jgi:hypothetical protein